MEPPAPEPPAPGPPVTGPPVTGPAAPDPAVLAAVAAAVDQVWPRAQEEKDAADPAHRVWRFSGRWWNKPTPIRRDRPWAG